MKKQQESKSSREGEKKYKSESLIGGQEGRVRSRFGREVEKSGEGGISKGETFRRKRMG